MEIERLGPYQIIRELGRGGMGIVYEGLNLETEEPAAVKLLSAVLARQEGFRDRFETEIETLRKLKHSNIVRLFGFGEQDGDLFYAMELVDGSSLEQELGRGRPFDWREVTRIAIETCRALRHAHDRGVIHRDIKPGNLLLTNEGQLKLSDFGIARLFGSSGPTNVGGVLGTAEYMAPEQAEGRPVGPRADMYSLGVVLYVLLTRRPLFRARSLPELLHKQRFETPDRVAEHAPDVPVMLEAIVAQLLEKDPERRIPNPTILARQLAAMERGLALQDETAGAEAGSCGAANDAGSTPSAADDKSSDSAQLPSTQMADDREFQRSAATEPAASPPENLLETKATSAFKNREEAAATEGRSPSTRFTTVAEEELDQIQTGEPHRPWISIQTWALAVGLSMVGLAVWYFLQPPSADALYEKIRVRAAGGENTSLLQAERDIAEFLIRFPDDTRCQQLREYETEIELRHLEKTFERRARRVGGTDDLVPIERAYLEAISYAKLDPERGMAKLQALIDLYDHGRDSSGPTGKCLELARRRLERIHQELGEETIHHRALVQDRLDLADGLRQTEPERARAMYEAVIELYQNKPWAAEAVRRARQALGNP